MDCGERIMFLRHCLGIRPNRLGKLT